MLCLLLLILKSFMFIVSVLVLCSSCCHHYSICVLYISAGFGVTQNFVSDCLLTKQDFQAGKLSHLFWIQSDELDELQEFNHCSHTEQSAQNVVFFSTNDDTNFVCADELHHNYRQ